MEHLPLKSAPFYTFLVSFLLLETFTCARDLCALERSFRQVKRQFQSTDAVGLNLTIPPRVLHNTEENLL